MCRRSCKIPLTEKNGCFMEKDKIFLQIALAKPMLWCYNTGNLAYTLRKRGAQAPLFLHEKGVIIMKITEIVAGFARPVVEQKGCTLWDVEYVREGSDFFLRLYIDKEGGVDISDCEAISRAVDPILDEKDPISESYHFEVCSAGLERALKRPGDFERFMGSPIMVKLYRPRNGLKELPGILRGYDNGRVTAECGKETITFEKSEVALVRLRVEF